jgi:hypothetical protein
VSDAIQGEVLPQDPAAELAHRSHTRIKAVVGTMKRLWVELAEELHTFVRSDMWRDLGYSTLEEWLADPDIELKRRYVFELVANWQELVIERGVSKEDLARLKVTKVREVLPAVRRGLVELEVALADVESLPRRDLEIRYRGLASGSTGGQPDTDSTIRTEAEPRPVANCPTCGGRGWVDG